MKQLKKNLNPVPSSFKPKKRYILFSLSCEKQLNDFEVKRSVSDFFLSALTPTEFAKQNIFVVKWSFEKQKGILRCERNFVAEAKQLLLALKKINNFSIAAKVLLVSGTIKKLKERI